MHIVNLSFNSTSLQVYDGDSSDYLGLFCGDTAPRELRGESESVIIKFVSSQSDNYRGFLLEWTSVGMYESENSKHNKKNFPSNSKI